MNLRTAFIATAALIALLCVQSSSAAPGSGQQRRIDVQRSTITVHVFKSGLLRALADNHVVQAALADGWVEDSGAARVDVIVDAQRLRVLDPDASPKDREQVQARMLGPEVLDAARFPQIRFHSTGVQPIGTDRWLIRGSVELHGHTHDVAMQVVRENDRYRGQTTLRQTDFGINPVSVAGGAVRVKDELTIDFDIVTIDR